MILVFSGTGNSLHVANLLSETLHDKVLRLPIREDAEIPLDDTRIIWVFPVYSWGVPPVVKKIIEGITIPNAEKAVHYAVMTCGDDIGLADKMWRKAVEKRGWSAAGVYSVQMPNTYVLMAGFDVDSPQIATQKVEQATSRVKSICESISHTPGKPHVDVVRGSFPWIKTKIIYPWFVKFDMSPKPFHSTDQCIGCAKCQRICPMKNITMIDHRPNWGDNCALCLGCYHVCPCHAVAYGKITSKKGQKQIL